MNIIIKKYMKNISPILLFLLLISCINSNTYTNITGNWKGSYNDQELLLTFDNDNKCILKYFNDQSNYFETITGNYTLDFTKKPIPLSITNIPQLNHSMYTIVEFICEDSIRIAKFSPKWRLRPISFKTGKTINLKRISKK